MNTRTDTKIQVSGSWTRARTVLENYACIWKTLLSGQYQDIALDITLVARQYKIDSAAIVFDLATQSVTYTYVHMYILASNYVKLKVSKKQWNNLEHHQNQY